MRRYVRSEVATCHVFVGGLRSVARGDCVVLSGCMSIGGRDAGPDGDRSVTAEAGAGDADPGIGPPSAIAARALPKKGKKEKLSRGERKRRFIAEAVTQSTARDADEAGDGGGQTVLSWVHFFETFFQAGRGEDTALAAAPQVFDSGSYAVLSFRSVAAAQAATEHLAASKTFPVVRFTAEKEVKARPCLEGHAGIRLGEGASSLESGARTQGTDVVPVAGELQGTQAPDPAALVAYRRQDLPRPAFSPERFGTAALPPLPPGLVIELDFLSPAEESALIAWLDAQGWETSIKRRVQHYGFRFDYKSLKHCSTKLQADPASVPGRSADSCAGYADSVPEIPRVLSLAGRFDISGVSIRPDESSAAEKQKEVFDQVTVNEYHPGIGIAAHVETHSCFEEGFCSVSLLSGIVMDFTDFGEVRGDPQILGALRTAPGTAPGAGAEGVCPQVVSVYLPPRSRVVVSGEARFRWKHAIASRSTDLVDGALLGRSRRVSLTYRRVRRVPFCDCAFPHLCDFQDPGALQLPNRIEMAPSKAARDRSESPVENGVPAAR
eukprot:gene132-334_t